MIIALMVLVLFWIFFRRWLWFFFGLMVATFLFVVSGGAKASAAGVEFAASVEADCRKLAAFDMGAAADCVRPLERVELPRR
jgi:hypothetical protein